MKAIIIQDNDARALLDSLKLSNFEACFDIELIQLQEKYKFNQKELESIKSALHGKFHYVVCRWLQEQGASIVRS